MVECIVSIYNGRKGTGWRGELVDTVLATISVEPVPESRLLAQQAGHKLIIRSHDGRRLQTTERILFIPEGFAFGVSKGFNKFIGLNGSAKYIWEVTV